MMNNKSLKMMKRDVEAISPVVATLLLVLVAVAAATAFFVFESNWQTQQTDKVKNVDIDSGAPYTLTVSGSTTVYEFMAPAAEAWMADHQNAQVTVDGIGSGAGANAIASGQCDIGMVSSDWATASSFATLRATHPEIVATNIAYDAVVIIVAKNAHGLTAADLANLNTSIMQQIYSVTPTINTWGELLTALNHTSADTTPLVKYERADESGTEDCFNSKVLGGSGQLASGIANQSAQGNQGMIDAVKGNPDAIGFTSMGMASANSATLSVFQLNHVAASVSTVKAAILNTVGDKYVASRPLQVLVNTDMHDKDAQIQAFIDFILEPGNNMEFCADGSYISIYS